MPVDVLIDTHHRDSKVIVAQLGANRPCGPRSHSRIPETDAVRKPTGCLLTLEEILADVVVTIAFVLDVLDEAPYPRCLVRGFAVQ